MAAPVLVRKGIKIPIAAESVGGASVTITAPGFVPTGHFIRGRLDAAVLKNNGAYSGGDSYAVLRAVAIGARNDTGAAESDAYTTEDEIVAKADVLAPVIDVYGDTGALEIAFDPASETATFAIVGVATVDLYTYANSVEFVVA